MKTVMVNFRADQDLVDEIDRAADMTGQNRSEFIRLQMEQIVRAVKKTDSTTPPIVLCADGNHPEDKIALTPWGVRICQVCGTRMR